MRKGPRSPRHRIASGPQARRAIYNRKGSALDGLGGRGLRSLGSVEMAGGAGLGGAGRFSGGGAQIIELGAADGAAADDLDRFDVGRIKREDALDTLAEADLADREGAAEAAIGPRDADAFEILDAGALALDHLDADAERIARAEFGDGLGLAELLDGLGLELLDEVHLIRPCSSHAARQRAMAFARPHDARSGPAALAVSLPPPWPCARRRSSHDPPIAALRGSCALPI